MIECEKHSRKHSQARFVHHEALASGALNLTRNGATSAQLQPWEAHLQNSSAVTHLMVDRMTADFECLPPKLRKPWSGKDLEPQPALTHVLGVKDVILTSLTSSVAGPRKCFKGDVRFI